MEVYVAEGEGPVYIIVDYYRQNSLLQNPRRSSLLLVRGVFGFDLLTVISSKSVEIFPGCQERSS